MSEMSDAEYEEAKNYDDKKNKELWDRVGREMDAYESKSFLEQFGLYMLRIQMYELSLKRDLMELFDVPEDKVERMNLSSILRFYEKNDIRAHPGLYAHITKIAQQRNVVAHEFLADAGNMIDIVGESVIRLFYRDLYRMAMDLEFAYQFYLMQKELDSLYQDWGAKPTYPYPKDDNFDE